MIRVTPVPKSPLYAIAAQGYSPLLVWAAKSVPGMRWEERMRGMPWVGYPDAVEVVVSLLASRKMPVDSRELPAPGQRGPVAFPFVTETGAGKIRPYQEEGIRFLISQCDEGALLADGMRLGKTNQSLIAARYFKARTLIVCPSNAVGVWSEPATEGDSGGEIAKWWPQKSGAVFVCEGVKDIPTAIPPETQLVVIHQDILYAWVDQLLAWDFKTLVIDEIHNFAGYDSRRSKAIRALARHAVRRMGLSGTPMTSRPRDLHNVVDLLCPGRFGVFHIPPALPGERKQKMAGFAQRYANAHLEDVGAGPDKAAVWKFDGKSNEDELHRRLSYFMLRRIKSEVDSQLPPKTRQIVPVNVASKYAIKPTHQTLLNKTNMRRALDLAADGKLTHVLSLLRSHIEEEEKVVCFTYRRAFADAVADHLMTKGIRCEVAHGGVTRAERDKRIRELRTSKDPCVLAATIDTCSTAIDLSFASVIVFAEITWEPHELVQAEERVYRVGDSSKALIQYVIARGTGDELVVHAVINKLDTFDRVIGKVGDKLGADLRGEEDKGLKRLSEALALKMKRLKEGRV